MRVKPSVLCCVCVLLLSFALAGCVASQKNVSAPSVDEMIRIAEIEDKSTKKAIREYFSKRRKHKALSVDPFDKEFFRWAERQRSAKEAMKKVVPVGSKALFAVDGEFVWESSLSEYMASNMGKGRKAYKEHDYGQAIQFFQASLREYGENWYVLNRLGWALLNARDYQGAAKSFQRSLEFKHKDFSRVGLAEALLMTGEPEAALEELEKVSGIKSYAEREHAEYIKAVCYASMGKYEKCNSLIGRYRNIGLNSYSGESGLVVRYVYPGGPAEYAGVQAGDVLVEFEGTSIEGWDIRSYRSLISRAGVGNVVSIRFIRDGMVYTSQIVNGFAADLPEKATGLDTVVPVNEGS